MEVIHFENPYTNIDKSKKRVLDPPDPPGPPGTLWDPLLPPQAPHRTLQRTQKQIVSVNHSSLALSALNNATPCTSVSQKTFRAKCAVHSEP